MSPPNHHDTADSDPPDDSTTTSNAASQSSETETHSLSFDIDSVDGLAFLTQILQSVATNDSLTDLTVSVSAEATEPFDPPQLPTDDDSLTQLLDEATTGQAGLDVESTTDDDIAAEAKSATQSDTTAPEEGDRPAESGATADAVAESTPDSTPPPEPEPEPDAQPDPDDSPIGPPPTDTPPAEPETASESSSVAEPAAEPDSAELSDDLQAQTGRTKPLDPTTWKFRCASALATLDQPLTAAELESVFAGTEWERQRSNWSGTLNSLHTEGLTSRSERPMDGGGINPYEHALTDAGEALTEASERYARTNDQPTAADVLPDDAADQIAATYAEEDTDESSLPDDQTQLADAEDTATTTTTDTETDTSTEAPAPAEPDGLDVPPTGDESAGASTTEETTRDQPAPTETAPSPDTPESEPEPESESEPEPESESEPEPEAESEVATPTVSLDPSDREFRAASALYYAAKPTSARTLGSRLEDTLWEYDSRNTLNADLKWLVENGLATRSQRREERGNPYEYTLTDVGRSVVEDAIATAEQSDDYETFESVITKRHTTEPDDAETETEEEEQGETGGVEEPAEVEADATDDSGETNAAQTGAGTSEPLPDAVEAEGAGPTLEELFLPNSAQDDVTSSTTAEAADTDTDVADTADAADADTGATASTAEPSPEETTEAGDDDVTEEGFIVKGEGMSAGFSMRGQQVDADADAEADDEFDPAAGATEGFAAAEPADYAEGGFVSRDAITITEGDFIRYMKNDGVIYQGTVLPGQPVENGFDHYPGQEDDLVVQLDYEDGKHVAHMDVQQEDRLTVRTAQGQTMHGRNVETVAPDELIAVSPKDEYDWYRIREAWDEDTDELLLDPDDL